MSQGIHLRKYGVQATIDFEVYEVDGVNLRVDWVPVAADCEIMKDGGASTQCTNTAVDEGSTYSIVLTATEMQAARLVLKVVDAATKAFLDKIVIIETYGNAAAQHAMDFDDPVRAGLTALPNAAADAAGGLPISDAGGLDLDVMNTNINDIETDTVEIGIAGAGLTAINLPNQTMDIIGNITGNLSGSVGSLTGHTNQTGDNFARLGAPAGASVSADIAAIPTVDEIWAKAMSDLAQGAPSATASVLIAINYLYEMWRNKVETTAARITAYKDDGVTELVRSTISDDATTFTKGEMVTGV